MAVMKIRMGVRCGDLGWGSSGVAEEGAAEVGERVLQKGSREPRRYLGLEEDTEPQT